MTNYVNGFENDKENAILSLKATTTMASRPTTAKPTEFETIVIKSSDKKFFTETIDEKFEKFYTIKCPELEDKKCDENKLCKNQWNCLICFGKIISSQLKFQIISFVIRLADHIQPSLLSDYFTESSFAHYLTSTSE